MRPNRSATVILTLCCACSDDPGSGDDAGVDGGSTARRCQVDDHNRAEKAVPLTLGTRYDQDTYLCPPTDRDWFKFNLPAGQPLVTVQLAYPVGATSAVELAYDIYRASDLLVPIARGRDAVTTDNRSAITFSHFLSAAAGEYFLVVRDDGNEDQDSLNSYAVTVSSAADPDQFEPNESCDAARALSGSGVGVIASTGDRDAYLVIVPEGVQILSAELTTASASPVDLKLSLFRATGELQATEIDPRGEDGPTTLLLRRGMTGAAQPFCLIVEDDDGEDLDREVPYTLTIAVAAEDDQNELTRRNDRPETAIDLGRGRTVTGKINAKADLDWFRIDTTVGQIVQVRLDCPGCEIQPTVNIVYADEAGPRCSADTECSYLLTRARCTRPADCGSGACVGVGEDRFCARQCGDRLDCPGLQCQQSGGINACAGAAVCLPGTPLCGVLQYTETAEATLIDTAQPARGPRTYVLVRDFQDDNFSVSDYTLEVVLRTDPDTAQEPNNFYAPYRDINFAGVLGRSAPEATPLSWRRVGDHYEVSGRGCIAYEGDVDVFRLVGGNPCTLLTAPPDAGIRDSGPPDTGASDAGAPDADPLDADTSSDAGSLDAAGFVAEGASPNQNCGLEIAYSRPEMSGIDFAYFLYNQGFGGRASFSSVSEGTETRFGDAICGGNDSECAFFYGTDQNDYFLVVRDFGQDSWDTRALGCYDFTIRAASDHGCPASCPTVAGNGLCTCE